MAWHCFDPVASALAGRRVFKPPYPDGGNWHEERRRNGIWFEIMETAVRADEVFRKDAPDWTADDMEFVRWTLEHDK